MTEKPKQPAPKAAQPPKEPKISTGKADLGRSFALTAVMAVVLIAFFNVPFYKTWLLEKSPEKNGRVARYREEMKKQKSSDPIEARKEARYGVNYSVAKYLIETLKKGDTLLIPPQQYLLENLFSEQNPTAHSWVHPCYIYYHAGRIPTVWVKDSINVKPLYSATHTFYIDPTGNLGMISLRDSATKRQIIEQFRHYPLSYSYQVGDVLALVRAGKLKLKKMPNGVDQQPTR
jgi:hypothetical protein